MSSKFILLVLMHITIILINSTPGVLNKFATQIINGSYWVNISEQVDETKEVIIRFPDSSSKYPYTVFAWSEDVYFTRPVFIVVTQQNKVTSWEIPIPVRSKAGLLYFKSTSRTLCHDSMEIISQVPRNTSFDGVGENSPELTKKLSLSISTASKIPVSVGIRVEEQTNFYVVENQEYIVTISPSEPKYFYYKFPVNADADEYHTSNAILEVHSEDDVCLTVSIQNPLCPVSDLDQDVRFKGKYETVDTKGGIIIMVKLPVNTLTVRLFKRLFFKRNKFPNGFFIVFVAKGDNYECSRESSVIPMPKIASIIPLNRSADLIFNLKPSISSHEYLVASLTTLAAIFLFYVVFSLTTWGFYRWGYRVTTQGDEKSEEKDKERDGEEVLELENHDQNGAQNDIRTVANIDEIDSKLLQSNLVLTDLARKDPEHFEKRSFAYLWHVISIAIFYGIPVVQLVITYQRVLNMSGDLDICYYNFLCAHPLFGLSDFNHIYSNIGYGLVGILFLAITFYKQKFVLHNDEHGIPKHYGLFYAMGVALIMEGVLSACYHVCPTQSNFQFDTSFMYVMAALCLVKLYQNRHPDINATAHATFVVLGIAIFSAMVGVLNGHIIFWIIFIILYVALCFYVSCNIYFLSYAKRGVKRVIQVWKAEHNIVKTIRPKRRAHVILLLVANIFNLVLAIMGILFYHIGTDFATFLLVLLMANVIMYAIFYVTMKVIHHEKICNQATIFGIVGLITWGAAGYFFIKKSSLWTVTAAESRQWNTHCIMLDFYDNHDVWHLLSAPALFFSFMLLLTLDDDLINTPHANIAVF